MYLYVSNVISSFNIIIIKNIHSIYHIPFTHTFIVFIWRKWNFNYVYLISICNPIKYFVNIIKIYKKKTRNSKFTIILLFIHEFFIATYCFILNISLYIFYISIQKDLFNQIGNIKYFIIEIIIIVVCRFRLNKIYKWLLIEKEWKYMRKNFFIHLFK
jgi:hypothetical protein